jgi:hypothetical protein
VSSHKNDFFSIMVFVARNCNSNSAKKIAIQNWSIISSFDYTYSSGQKFLNDHSIWHNFFVSQLIDLKF